MNLLRKNPWCHVLAIGVMACSGEPTSIPNTSDATQNIRRLEARAEQALTGWGVDSVAIAGNPSLSQLFAAAQGTSGFAALADEEPSSAVIQLSSTQTSVTPLEVRASTQYIGNTASHLINAAITSSAPGAINPPPWTFDVAGSGTSLGPAFTFLFTSLHPLSANVACDFTLSASTSHAAWYQIPNTPWPIINEMTGGVWGRVTAGDGNSASGPSCVTFQQPGEGGGGDDTLLEPDPQWYICTTFYVYVGGVLAEIIDGGCRPV